LDEELLREEPLAPVLRAEPLAREEARPGDELRPAERADVERRDRAGVAR
jgi:hypothetical protein